MNFSQTLIQGRLVKRYKRFLADVELANGEVITAHCANPGSMLGLKEPGLKVWLSKSDNPKRKLAYSWELAEIDDGERPALVGINTSLPNKLVKEAIENSAISELTGYDQLRTEVKYGQSSRVDFLLEFDRQPLCYVEVKNVHLMRKTGLAEFPDSVTRRGTKHLGELAEMVTQGHRAVMFYLIQRTDAKKFRLARDIDPDYANAFDIAITAGVEVICYDCNISTKSISVSRKLRLPRRL